MIALIGSGTHSTEHTLTDWCHLRTRSIGSALHDHAGATVWVSAGATRHSRITCPWRQSYPSRFRRHWAEPRTDPRRHVYQAPINFLHKRRGGHSAQRRFLRRSGGLHPVRADQTRCVNFEAPPTVCVDQFQPRAHETGSSKADFIRSPCATFWSVVRSATWVNKNRLFPAAYLKPLTGPGLRQIDDACKMGKAPIEKQRP